MPMTPPSPPAPKPPELAAASTEAAPPADATLSWVLAAVGVIGVLLTAAGVIGWGLRAGLGVGIGAAMAAANLYVFIRVVRGLLGEGRHRRVWILVAVVKLVVLFGGLYLLLRSGVASGLALLTGYGALPLGITIGGLIAPRPPEAPRPH